MAPSPTKRKDRSEEKSKDRSKDKGATKESGEKDRGRDKTRKRRSASSGSSSTRSRSSSTSSSGSSSSTGSSSGSVSLSRCPSGDASAELQFAISEPTPGVQISCPQDAFAVALDLSFPTPDCSAWTMNDKRTPESFRRLLLNPLEEKFSCGVSELYLQGLNLTCVNSVVKVSGRVRARRPVQQQSIESWCRGLLASPQLFCVNEEVLKTSPECIAPRSTPASSQSSSSLRSWEITPLVVGASLLVVFLVGLALHFIKRHSQNYTNTEMNDCREMAADV